MSAPPSEAVCPDTVVAQGYPGTRPEHETLSYWIEQLGARQDLDEVLLEPGEVARHNAAIRQPGLGHTDILAPIDDGEFRKKVTERLDWLRTQVESGKYHDRDGAALTTEHLAAVSYQIQPTLRVALKNLSVRCAPRLPGYFKVPVDTDFDRNNCSTIHAQEPVQVVASWPGGLQLVRSRYTMGWVSGDASMSPPIPSDQQKAWVRGAKRRLVEPLDVAAGKVEAGTLLPETPDAGGVWVGSNRSIDRTPNPSGSQQTRRSLTRRALLTTAFEYVGTPYGWGGQDGGRDCSRFLLDTFSAFGLELPRFSGDQARTGTFAIDVSEVKGDVDRMLLIDSAARRGMVLLYFPGHIMLYLGRDDTGQPMAVHSFAEYLAPCTEGDGETVFTNRRVAVTNLELGRGSSRKAFVERITKIAVIGKPPGEQLDGIATLRPAAPLQEGECDVRGWGDETTLYLSPRRPNTGQPLRVIVTSDRDRAPAELVLWGPDGQELRPKIQRVGGPPYGFVATVPALERGRWRAAFGDGDRTSVCKSFDVGRRGAVHRPCREADEEGEGGDPVWKPTRAWGPRSESLFSVFVERLFDHPIDEDHTWTNLQDILKDEDRNILFNHFGRNEDHRLRLTPDCADLPFFLRTYFAWKMRLPMGFRKCNRGRAGRPPTCGSPLSNKIACEGKNDIQGFEKFTRRYVGGSVHSGSGRTSPYDDSTDYYPVPLTREALKPGTVYIDPHGHVMIVVRWVPQGTDSYGVLVAADAQPDGTIGRRRFWRGTFLFTPDTQDVGAGFKAFRPVRNATGDSVLSVTNEELKTTEKFTPYSEDQYRGSKEDFYDRMASLINPRPLDPFAMQTTLVEALDESVRRRVVSVNNAVEYTAAHKRAIEMPTGYSIFETSGPWEDYSTPSRDMRLLIAIDTVVQFPDRVSRAPARYGISEKVDERVAGLRAHMRAELEKRTIQYVASDGSSRTLTLGDIVDRSQRFEMSYNPNDCVEIRWAEPEGDGMKTCTGRAPPAQTARMESYRAWFETRTRPPR